ncbi:hypothetical protein Aperf_G00000089347 [Anoplocephala perfoliata]
MFYVSTLTHKNICLLLSIIILLHLVSLCRSQISNSDNQSLTSASTLNPVINTVQLLLNNGTQLHFKSYSRIKDLSVDLLYNRSSNPPPPSELIFIDENFFDYQHCLLKDLTNRNNSWLAIIDLKEECSSMDVVLSVLKSARSNNESRLRGILFYVDKIPSVPSLHGLVNRSELTSVPLYAFLLPRKEVPPSLQRCSDALLPCTVLLSPASPEGTFSRLPLWIHRSATPLSQSSPSAAPSPFPRHRLSASSHEQHGNQSIVRPDGAANGGAPTAGGGVINVEDAFLNRSSVLFVAVSFILLMFISLAWLVFYYVQRFRYLHSKERASRRLAELARKAVARIPLKLLQAGDKEIGANGEHCAICIEPYRPFDNIRILPCRHYFHKLCIDPWLLEQRSCPMCKLDILQAYDFRPDMDRSCPASSGGDSSSAPTVPVAGTSAGPSSSPVLIRAGVEHGGERDEEVVLTVINNNNETRDDGLQEGVTTASVSTSYHDLEHRSDGSLSRSGRGEWLRGLFRSSSASNPQRHHQNQAHISRRFRTRNMDVVAAAAERSAPNQSQISAHLLSENVDSRESLGSTPVASTSTTLL